MIKLVSAAIGVVLLVLSLACISQPKEDLQVNTGLPQNVFERVPKQQWVAESKNAYVIRDKNPVAPVHFLIIPKKQVPTLLDAPPELLGEMLELAKTVAMREGLAKDGFRLVVNTNSMGGQHVFQLHIHLLAGRQMQWPPG